MFFYLSDFLETHFTYEISILELTKIIKNNYGISKNGKVWKEIDI